MKKKGVIYTCITGNYDRLRDHSYINPDWDYICFTDDLSIRNDSNLSWEIRPLIFNGLDNARINRWHKLHPHILFPEYDKSIYVDANINFSNHEIFDDINTAIKEDRKMSIGKHPYRNCLYEELEACLKFGKDDENVMRKQVDLIKKDNFPKNYGLFENNIIYREHHNKDIIKIMDDWWWWIENFSKRDQLSLTYVLWKNNYKILPLNNMPYRKSQKIRVWRDGGHITKEEINKRKKIFTDFYKKRKTNQR